MDSDLDTTCSMKNTDIGANILSRAGIQSISPILSARLETMMVHLYGINQVGEMSRAYQLARNFFWAFTESLLNDPQNSLFIYEFIIWQLISCETIFYSCEEILIRLRDRINKELSYLTLTTHVNTEDAGSLENEERMLMYMKVAITLREMCVALINLIRNGTNNSNASAYNDELSNFYVVLKSYTYRTRTDEVMEKVNTIIEEQGMSQKELEKDYALAFAINGDAKIVNEKLISNEKMAELIECLRQHVTKFLAIIDPEVAKVYRSRRIGAPVPSAEESNRGEKDVFELTAEELEVGDADAEAVEPSILLSLLQATLTNAIAESESTFTYSPTSYIWRKELCDFLSSIFREKYFGCTDVPNDQSYIDLLCENFNPVNTSDVFGMQWTILEPQHFVRQPKTKLLNECPPSKAR